MRCSPLIFRNHASASPPPFTVEANTPAAGATVNNPVAPAAIAPTNLLRLDKLLFIEETDLIRTEYLLLSAKRPASEQPLHVDQSTRAALVQNSRGRMCPAFSTIS